MVPVAMLLLSFLYNNTPFIIKDEAHQAFELINDIRSNPDKYPKKLQLNSQLHIGQPLRWNDTLARAAEAKAMDMAKRNYFNYLTPEGYAINHFFPYNDSTHNVDGKNDPDYIEFIEEGSASGAEAIKTMITDRDDTFRPRRNHLQDFIGTEDTSLYDIGIGFVKSDGSNSQSYTCIIILKHQW
jgi:cysteine-rich secretory family protein